MDDKKVCSKCKGDMIPGKIGSYGGMTWQPQGKLFGAFGGKKMIIYACQKCGYTETYIQI